MQVCDLGDLCFGGQQTERCGHDGMDPVRINAWSACDLSKRAFCKLFRARHTKALAHLCHGALDEERGHGADGDPLMVEFSTERDSERVCIRLRARVHGEQRGWRERAAARAHVDHHAPARGAHVREEERGHAIDGGDVDSDDPVDQLVWHVRKTGRHLHVHAHVVDQDLRRERCQLRGQRRVRRRRRRGEIKRDHECGYTVLALDRAS